MSFVLDTKALIAVDRGDRRLRSTLEWARAGDLITSSAVIARVWRGGPRQAEPARFLSSVAVYPLTSDVGRELGVLLGRSGTGDVVDAHVAWLARAGDVVFTSDPDDLARLLEARGVGAAVRRV